jgi:4-aminobutyrate aminotransferase
MAVKKLRAVSGGKSAEDDRSPPTPRDVWQAGLGDSTRAMLDADRRASLAETPDRLDVIERAHGALLVDRDGREILDFDGAGTHSVGYGHPRVIAAVTEQIEALSFSPPGYTNPPAIALAQRLAELAPGDLSGVLLSPSNTSAIASAIALARASIGRHRILTIGDVVGREGLLISGVEHAPPLDRAARSLGDDGRGFERLAELIDVTLGRAGDFAAVLAEPMDWAMVVPPPAEFWSAVKASCERTGTLLIFDETQSAIGRTGTMFYCEQAGAVPDILVVGTGLGGGVVPVAAVIARDLPATPAVNALAQSKNPVAAAAALATLEVIAEDDLLERARGLGHRSLDHLKDIAARFPIFREARGVGLTLGLELADPGADDRAQRMLYACLERGLSFRIGGGRVIALTPPLTISVPEIERTFEIIEAAAADC